MNSRQGSLFQTLRMLSKLWFNNRMVSHKVLPLVQQRCLLTIPVQWKERSKYPFNQPTDELELMMRDKIDEIVQLRAQDVYDGDFIDHKEFLSMVLYQFYMRQEFTKLLEVFAECRENNVVSDTAYIILMRYYADCADLPNVLKLFDAIRADPHADISSRAFTPLVVAHVKCGEFSTAMQHLCDMMETMKQRSYNDKLFANIVSECAKMRNHHEHQVAPLVTAIFDYIKSYGIQKVHRNTVEAIKEWFQSDPNCKWEFKPTTIHRRNRKCQCCQQQLASVHLSTERLNKLKVMLQHTIEERLFHLESPDLLDKFSAVEHDSDYAERRDEHRNQFLSVLKNSLPDDKSSSSVRHTPAEKRCSSDILADLRFFLDEHEPFDVIIDSQNMGYYEQKGFQIDTVRGVVEHFSDRNKRVLLICADTMRSTHLRGNALKNEKPHVKRLRQQMHVLATKCTFYFSQSSLVDDLCLLYTIAHHNFRVQIVSHDLFRNHLHVLDADTRTAFKRWQLAQQLRPLKFPHDNKPVFQPLMTFNTTLQKNGDSWHLPVSDGALRMRKERSAWLCIQKASQLHRLKMIVNNSN